MNVNRDWKGTRDEARRCCKEFLLAACWVTPLQLSLYQGSAVLPRSSTLQRRVLRLGHIPLGQSFDDLAAASDFVGEIWGVVVFVGQIVD